MSDADKARATGYDCTVATVHDSAWASDVGRDFLNERLLMNHMMVHTHEDPFPCINLLDDSKRPLTEGDFTLAMRATQRHRVIRMTLYHPLTDEEGLFNAVFKNARHGVSLLMK